MVFCSVKVLLLLQLRAASSPEGISNRGGKNHARKRHLSPDLSLYGCWFWNVNIEGLGVIKCKKMVVQFFGYGLLWVIRGSERRAVVKSSLGEKSACFRAPRRWLDFLRCFSVCVCSLEGNWVIRAGWWLFGQMSNNCGLGLKNFAFYDAEIFFVAEFSNQA